MNSDNLVSAVEQQKLNETHAGKRTVKFAPTTGLVTSKKERQRLEQEKLEQESQRLEEENTRQTIEHRRIKKHKEARQIQSHKTGLENSTSALKQNQNTRIDLAQAARLEIDPNNRKPQVCDKMAYGGWVVVGEFPPAFAFLYRGVY
jgi:hypothetical protein